MSKKLSTKPVKFLSKEELEKLPTKRLMAYRKRLFTVPGLSYTNMEGVEVLGQDSVEWIDTYKFLKEILDTREHVPRG